MIPTHYGYVEGAGPDGARKLYFGDNDVHTVRAGMEIANPMSDGIGAFSSPPTSTNPAPSSELIPID